MAISSPGLGSNLDVNSIVSQQMCIRDSPKADHKKHCTPNCFPQAVNNQQPSGINTMRCRDATPRNLWRTLSTQLHHI